MSDDILAVLVNVLDNTEEKTIICIGHQGREGGAHLTPRWILRAAAEEIRKLRDDRQLFVDHLERMGEKLDMISELLTRKPEWDVP